jgi:2-polyprenyl-3-methyl-5-hydroxy-6-metoxy-1,4-benzoquinol methylase
VVTELEAKQRLNFGNESISIQQDVAWIAFETEVMPLIIKYMPKTGEILDAGCGRGVMLIHLLHLGYPIRGCEISEANINLIKQFDPNIIVDREDVLDMSYKDNQFDAMLSFGVMEHFERGPEQALKEAHRVLKSGGILFVSVPYTTWYRRIKQRIKSNKVLRKVLGKKPEIKKEFIELDFTKQEFSRYLEGNKFMLLESIPILKKHFIAGWSSLLRGQSYPKKIDYGVLLNPPLSKLGMLIYRIAAFLCPWVIGHFQFFVASAKK